MLQHQSERTQRRLCLTILRVAGEIVWLLCDQQSEMEAVSLLSVEYSLGGAFKVDN